LVIGLRGLCGLCEMMSVIAQAQAPVESASSKKVILSPPTTASVVLNGKISVDYSAPSMRGRTVIGGLVPYGKVWRTGANSATTLKTDASINIGDSGAVGGTAIVPAGTYTLYTLPTEQGWKLIISKQTGQWGTVYKEDQDLARVDMTKADLPSPQELMSISFEKTSKTKTELHVRWEKTDVSVPVTVHAEGH